MLEKYYKENRFALVKCIKARKMQEADAEDVVQEAFVRALKYQDSFNPERQEVGAWFKTILNNTFKDYRHANYTGDYSFMEEVVDEKGIVEQNWIDRDSLQKVKKEISMLSEPHYSIVNLVVLNGYKYKEAAQILDQKLETVCKVLYRFKKSMREKYSE